MGNNWSKRGTNTDDIRGLAEEGHSLLHEEPGKAEWDALLRIFEAIAYECGRLDDIMEEG